MHSSSSTQTQTQGLKSYQKVAFLLLFKIIINREGPQFLFLNVLSLHSLAYSLSSINTILRKKNWQLHSLMPCLKAYRCTAKTWGNNIRSGTCKFKLQWRVSLYKVKVTAGEQGEITTLVKNPSDWLNLYLLLKVLAEHSRYSLWWQSLYAGW